MKTQVFLDGNKRASVIFANHYLISQGGGFLVIPEDKVPEFKKLLVQYYEGEDISIILAFMKYNCWKTFQQEMLKELKKKCIGKLIVRKRFLILS